MSFLPQLAEGRCYDSRGFVVPCEQREAIEAALTPEGQTAQATSLLAAAAGAPGDVVTALAHGETVPGWEPETVRALAEQLPAIALPPPPVLAPALSPSGAAPVPAAVSSPTPVPPTVELEEGKEAGAMLDFGDLIGGVTESIEKVAKTAGAVAPALEAFGVIPGGGAPVPVPTQPGGLTAASMPAGATPVGGGLVQLPSGQLVTAAVAAKLAAQGLGASMPEVSQVEWSLDNPIPGFDVLRAESECAGFKSPTAGIRHARPVRFIRASNPISQREEVWEHRGRPIVYTGDVQAMRRVIRAGRKLAKAIPGYSLCPTGSRRRGRR